MEEKTESEHSYSVESNSSSNMSRVTNDGDDETMEIVNIMGNTIEFPSEMCEDLNLFKDIFSMQKWNELDDQNKTQLKRFLPHYTANNKEETERTINSLFDIESISFGSPIIDFFNNINQGDYRPDIAKMRKFLKKARGKQKKHKCKAYYSKILQDIVISQERLIAAGKSAPPGPLPHLPLHRTKLSTKSKKKPYYLRVKDRYFEELAAISSEVGGELSEDDNYPEGLSEPKPKRRRQIAMQGVDNSVSGTVGNSDYLRPTTMDCLKTVLSAHRTRRQYRDNHPELNTTGITLEDIKERVAFVNGAKKLMFGGQKTDMPIQKVKRAPRKDSGKQVKNEKGAKKIKEEVIDIENKSSPIKVEIKIEKEESDSDNSFVDPITSPKSIKSKSVENISIKQEVVDKYPDNSSVNFSECKLDGIKQEPNDPSIHNPMKFIQPVPIKLEDLDGIDMMALPVELADDCGSVVPTGIPGVASNIGTQKALAANTGGNAGVGNTPTTRMNSAGSFSTNTTKTAKLTDGVAKTAAGGSTKSGSGLCKSSGRGIVTSSGEDIEPSLTESTHANFLSLVRVLFPAKSAHRASLQQLQQRCATAMKSPIAPLNTWYNLSEDWCGQLESALDFLAGERGPHPDDFVPYLQYIPETKMYQWIGAGRDGDAILARLCERWLRASSPNPPADPPPPRYPTTWVMRAPTNSEIAEFRAQERRRFSAATKPFTYIQHGYRSVVGPCVKGGGVAGAGGTTPLVASRPRAVSFPALVRDALARLPNGEGSRHDVITMLKMSQWIAPCSEQTLLTLTSATLEKLSAIRRDPIVKYDQRTATWIYLHRHRCEEDWLKSLPANSRGYRPKSATSNTIASAATRLRPQEPLAMDLDVGSVEEVIENASDSDVDVDDSSVPSSNTHLSSAQLLMQAQAANTNKQTQSKHKGKVTPTNTKTKLTATKPTPANTKQTFSQPKQTTPSKPTLMAQSAKQASAIAQLTKQNVKPIKQVSIVKQSIAKVTQVPVKTTTSVMTTKVQPVKTVTAQVGSVRVSSVVTEPSKSSPMIIAAPQKSPLLKHRPLLKVDSSLAAVSTSTMNLQSVTTTTNVVQAQISTAVQNQAKLTQAQATRSLLIRPPVVQTTVTSALTTSTTVGGTCARRGAGVLRVLSPAAPAAGKSLISPRALLQQGTPTTKKRSSAPTVTTPVTSVAQTCAATTVVSSAMGAVTSPMATRTVQLPGGRTVQLSTGHTLQLSSLQLPTHSVRLPSGQTVQLASPQTIQAIRAVSAARSPSTVPPRLHHTKPTLQIPVSTVQLAGQSVQLTGHTVKLPSGQSVQVASQSVQLPTGQTVQLGANVQTVQLSGQTVQLAGQTVQLPSGQTIQLAGGQTLQLASGQTVQLANQTPKSIAQVVRTQTAADKAAQPIVAKLLTNAQGQMISLEGVVGATRTIQVSSGGAAGTSGVVGGASGVVGGASGVVSGVSGAGRGAVRVVPPGVRPLLLTATKPLHNIILQSDGSALRVTSSGGATPTQTIVLSNIGAQAAATSTSTAPILKLHQGGGNVGVTSQLAGVRNVLMDGQQLKLVAGRHVLARLLRPASALTPALAPALAPTLTPTLTPTLAPANNHNTVQPQPPQ